MREHQFYEAIFGIRLGMNYADDITSILVINYQVEQKAASQKVASQKVASQKAASQKVVSRKEASRKVASLLARRDL